MTCTGCKKKNNTVEKMVAESVQNSDFKLRKNIGVIQINFGDGLFISPDNCDNELAVQFLKANPNRISMFEAYPTNWKELISDPITEEKSEDIQEAAEESKVADKASKKVKDGKKSK